MVMLNMQNIRFSNYKEHAILFISDKHKRWQGMCSPVAKSRKEMTMTRESKQFMACGACGSVVDGNGEIVSSLDQMMSGIKRVVRSFRQESSERKASPAVHA